MHSPRLLAALAVAGLTLTGCASDQDPGQQPATSTTTKAAQALSADQLATQVKARYRKKGLEVTCADGLAGEVGATSDCAATDGKKTVGIRATATDTAGKFDVLAFLDAETVVDTIAGSLEMQGYTGVSGKCDGELLGKVGAHQDCEVSTSGGTTAVNVDVTKVDGLTIDFTFKS